MKNSEIALVIVIAAVSIGVSYWAMNAILGNPSDKTETIRYMPMISNNVTAPSDEVFNVTAYNLNEDVITGKCGYGMVWDGFRCVKAENLVEVVDGEDKENQENPENSENSENQE